MKLVLLACHGLSLEPVTFDLSPRLTLLLRVSCLSLWHALLLWHEGISCCWLSLLSCPPTNLISQSTDAVEATVDLQSRARFTSQGQIWQDFSCQLQSFDRCRNSVKGQSRCLCASWDMSDTEIPVCPGLFLQKWLRFNMAEKTVSFYLLITLLPRLIMLRNKLRWSLYKATFDIKTALKYSNNPCQLQIFNLNPWLDLPVKST